ncbi:MAG: hypothetical protein ACI9TH_001187 [Kiritimatiellia bacterium]|jgi:hypothetical protein
MTFRRFLSAALVCSLAESVLNAGTIELTPQDDWMKVLHGDGLRPGDEVVLKAGVYSDARMLTLAHRGSRDRPIIIRGEGAVIKRPDARQNTINMIGVQYLKLQDIEITGGDTAIRISGTREYPARSVTLEGLHIHHIGGVGVTCNHEGNTYAEMHFLRNHIHHTGGHGEGFYLGGNDASAIFHSSIVELNYIHDLKGGTVSQGDGIELKHGSYGNLVRGNVIHDTKYPGIIVYGTCGEAVNDITGNLIWNSGDHGIQAAADAKVSGNVIVYPGSDGIYASTHQGAKPGNLLIHDNIVRVRGGGRAIRINRPDDGYAGQISVRDNLFMHERDGVAIRVAPEDGKLLIQRNRGQGGVEGVKLGVAQFDGRVGMEPIVYAPDERNPAWTILDRSALPWLE